MSLNVAGFKAYDIRGRIPDELNADIAVERERSLGVGNEQRLVQGEQQVDARPLRVELVELRQLARAEPVVALAAHEAAVDAVVRVVRTAVRGGLDHALAHQ